MSCPPTQRKRAARCREHGFTLIELLVAMVILSIALGLVASVVVRSISASSGSRAGAVSDSAVARAASRLADDVVLTNTADRRDNLLRDPADLEAALQRNADAYSSDPSTATRLLNIDEVVMATPTELQLIADVHRTDGMECVTWRASTAGGYELSRLVGTTCGSGEISNEVMVRASNPAAANIDTSPFSYRMLCSRTSCPSTGAPPASPCRPWVIDRPVAPNQRRWVIGVDAALGTISTDRSVASAHGMVRAAIRSRDTETYRRGLGC